MFGETQVLKCFLPSHHAARKAGTPTTHHPIPTTRASPLCTHARYLLVEAALFPQASCSSQFIFYPSWVQKSGQRSFFPGLSNKRGNCISHKTLHLQG